MCAAPPAEHEDGPDPRPVEAGRPGKERRPQPANRSRVESGRLTESRVVQCSADLFLQRVSRPVADRENEAGLGPVEERAVQVTQGELAEDPFLSQRFEAISLG